ncbi:hypothetical protein H845_2763 [Komagataeibacter xylinus E25]|nr:hypothetical protein H845_2763 [Komagataeibacter xylinus E25]
MEPQFDNSDMRGKRSVKIDQRLTHACVRVRASIISGFEKT